MDNTNTSSAGVSFPTLLTLLFIGLKLTNYITWSWVWVLSPMWITLAVVVVCALLVALLTP